MRHAPTYDATTNGQRLANLRRRRRLTQEQLGLAVGYATATIKAIEQGRRPLDRGSVILAFARALQCAPTDITGVPYLPDADPEAEHASSTIAAVHRALLMHGQVPRLAEQDVAAVDLDALAGRVRQAMIYRRDVTLARSGELLPGLLRDLQIAAHTLTGDQQRRAYRLLCYGYKCALSLARSLGHAAITTMAAERCRLAARQTDDPLLAAAAEWTWADEFIRVGEHDAAADIIDQALNDVSGAPADATQPEVLSLQGAFALKAALNSARAADAGGMTQGLEHAQRAADLLRADRDDYGLSFGPANVAIWSVSMQVELGRGREAVRRGERITLPTGYSGQRRSTLQIDLGRAHYMNGQREQALDCLLAAEQIAPQMTRLHPAVRETVGAMIRTAPRGRLAELGARVGVL
ncbi:helix-turn-helix transcriptional regulator [Microbispora sp. RL4-1S]|uniref:Helix-turn-helix transcriptional regulator n=1 Tax=Microbispora oryzae TaxID=2806554 RepID=A0A940WMT1_9ACTN|nr:helix-turn-helix transcriptional regulator [Microbispora oryzae]MBP2703494.1 helix-turn-helix transcriptional regulator [Microbispora oryzae]